MSQIMLEGCGEVEGPSEGGIALWHPDPSVALAGVAAEDAAGPVGWIVPFAVVDLVLVHISNIYAALDRTAAPAAADLQHPVRRDPLLDSEMLSSRVSPIFPVACLTCSCCSAVSFNVIVPFLSGMTPPC